MSKIQISKPTFLFQAGLLVKCSNKAIHSTKKSMHLSPKNLSLVEEYLQIIDLNTAMFSAAKKNKAAFLTYST
jgi:hypothetical protein